MNTTEMKTRDLLNGELNIERKERVMFLGMILLR